MNIKQIEKILTAARIEQGEAKIEAKMLVEHFLGIDEKNLIITPEFSETKELIEAIKQRSETRKPIQHIIGKAYFMGENFIVNDSVLIPRDETEILVRKAIKIIKNNNFKKVIDIGTGSGCIACMIAKNTEAQVLGIDVSTDALQTALDNSLKLDLFNKAIFRKSDLFSNIREDEKFDVIISNPPYIPVKEKDKLQIEVGFEPKSALFANDDKGIEFYRKITKQASKHLNNNGYLMFELGINQSQLVEELMTESGFVDIEIEKDLAYIDRIIYGRYK